MMKTIYTLAAIILFTSAAYAQQLPYISQLGESKSFWNPAATATGTEMHMDVFVRQQWVTFSGAPTTGYINNQYPMIDYNMSAGGNLYFDKTGPLNKIGFAINYAYKLQEFLSEEGQLSLGIAGGAVTYSLNTNNAIVNTTNDILLGKSSTGFAPTVGLGFHFLSDNRGWRSDNSFYVGFAYNQLYQSNLYINTLNQKRVSHMNFDLGTKIYGDDAYFEPNLSVNYVNPELMNILLGLKYEMRDKFWAGLGYSTINDVNIQGGIILPDFNGRDRTLRVGVMANAAITNTIQDFGPGFEFFLRYSFDRD